jgi:hypothetical protein
VAHRQDLSDASSFCLLDALRMCFYRAINLRPEGGEHHHRRQAKIPAPLAHFCCF